MLDIDEKRGTAPLKIGFYDHEVTSRCSIVLS